MTTEFWTNNPMILFNKDKINELWPMNNMTSNEKLNAITRLIIILTVLGYLITNNNRVFITGIITLAIIVILYYVQQNKESKLKDVKEGFTSTKLYSKLKDNFTNPTVDNPVMNVLMTEYSENPKRKPAAPSYNEVVEEEINEKAQRKDNKLFKNLGDNLSFEHSMRNFYAMPNTKIPNNQKDFAMFCYGNMPSCKEGSALQCSKNNALFRTT